MRSAIAQGKHLTTLAFSEAESRSHFWAPASTARVAGDQVVLDARKSWVTSAFEADSYVWSSKPVAAEGASTLWLVAADRPGLSQPGRFDGLGLRGNASTPITAQDVAIHPNDRLGEDGKGFDTMMGIVLPWFSTLSAIAGGRADTMLRVLEVKAACAEAALTVTDTAMRVCGGAAFRKEAGIERLFRDARAASVMAPTSDVLYDFIGKAITGLPLF